MGSFIHFTGYSNLMLVGFQFLLRLYRRALLVFLKWNSQCGPGRLRGIQVGRTVSEDHIILAMVSLSDYIEQITVKPVWNDHLYNKMYYLWFIQ